MGSEPGTIGKVGTSDKPGVAAMPSVRTVSFDAPWSWLAAGWRDLCRVPQVSLFYGAIFAIVAGLLIAGLTQFGWQSLSLALTGGFLLVGPMLGVGLYEVSHRLETGEPVRLADVLFVGTRSPGQLAFMGVLLLIVFFVWIEIALLMFMLFFGGVALPPAESFISTLLFTPRGLGLLIVGTVAGAVLAGTVFALSAVSVPLLMVRELDVITAATTSVRAVLKNPRAMALWAAIIAAAMAFGVATAFVGLVVAFPLIGHATWHAFRDLIDLDSGV